MTKAHEGSNLSVNGVKSLPEGMILFPLDGRLEDTTNSIPILLKTGLTYRNAYDSKFTGSVAVESATNNLAIAPLNTHEPYSTVVRNGQMITFQMLKQVLTITFPSITLTGKTFAVSGYFKKNGKPFTFTSTTMSTYNAPADNKRMYYDSKTGYFEAIEYYSHESARWLFHCYFPFQEGDIITIENFQVEEKDHVTSFVDGSRVIGNLKYDISSLGMSNAGCVSCWVRSSDSMVNNRATSGAVNNQYLFRLGGVHVSNDLVTLTIQNTSARKYGLRTTNTAGAISDLNDSKPVADYPIGSWNHFVIQWDSTGLPSGNKKEMFINGVVIASNDGTTIPSSLLTYLHVGNYSDNSGLIPSTQFEQLAIHPSKGFSQDEIRSWYFSQSPFFDARDSSMTF